MEKKPKKRLDWDEYLNHSFFKQGKEEDNKKLKFSNNYSIKIKQESEEEYPDHLKVVFLGEPCANKTDLIIQCCNPIYLNSEIKICSSIMSKTVIYPEFNKLIRFDLFDTAGQERFRSLCKIYIKVANVIIFVYNITSYNSFEGIKCWYNEVKNIHGEKMPILAVVGKNYENYQDMVVSNNEGLKFADEIGAIFQTTSKFSDNGINKLFDNIGKKYFYLIKEEYIKAKTLKESYKPKSDNHLCIII